ncbi:transmembrane amino acid transporter protein-domain-containing protein [Daldinia vernicosa]|uniref:transmembrane amino acid transporter protein-domain-containing protein n=1 Tax=Daldinia vernicosa TaxID=114800 RepID=UPI002007D3B3|nr:transmembrane amino acid transporter protein-domain-containing protein [Daldinia vernicosa]KAI0847755.1 transmembrane amino acid transporter protein-domain-containing protein [Daldinia vernicosa]
MKAEYSDEPLTYDTHETSIPTGWSAWFGGPNVKIGPRIAPQIASISTDVHNSTSDLSSDAILNKQLEEEAGHAIQYRTCSWQKMAALLFSEYICLAIMSFPWSYSVLGLVPGLILTVVQALLVLYTSIVLWEFCLRHPEVRDVCDIGQMLFWGQEWAWYFTAFMFILNNTFIQALHVLVGAKYLNTMVGPDAGISCQTVSFGAIVAVVCWLSSLPRTFNMLSKLGTASAVFTFISVILATIFAGVQGYPAGFNAEPATSPATGAALPFGNPIVTAVPVLGTTFVSGLGAFLNISYTFIGQITLPSFIAEMREPKDFPKALWACTILEIIVFSVVGAVTYAFVGNQYMTSPAFGSLIPLYKKIAFSFMVPTIIFLGVLYASVSARFIFFRIFQNSHHKNEHTLIGWGTWTLILFVTWVVGFVIANSIPFFNSLLALMSSLFDSFFGFIFWGLAYFRMRKADGSVALLKDRSFRGWFEGILNIIIILTGVFFLTAGTYVSVQGILDEFALGTVGTAFQCASNGI